MNNVELDVTHVKSTFLWGVGLSNRSLILRFN